MLHLLRPLGEGGMGKVWVARHKGLETEVVVKFLAEGAPAEREEAVARFAQEAAAAAAVKSPHVVQVFDHGTTPDGLLYIVMELLEGRDLARHLAQTGPMSPADVAAVVAQVAKALSKAHQAGVIHRDIKPENIFLCDGDGGEMFVKVLDFGIAKREQEATSKTSTGHVVGTPYYMSPEQLLGERPVDTRTDIWSLGVVAFEALTGKRPFEGATVGAITLSIHHSKPPRPSALVPTVPPALDEWFLRACSRAPEDRFQTAREAGQAIVAAAGEGQPTSATFRAPAPSLVDLGDPSLLVQPGGGGRSVTNLSASFPLPPSRRAPSPLLLGGAGLALAVLAVLVVFALRKPAEEPRGGHAVAPPAASSAEPVVVTSSVASSTPSTSAPAPVVEPPATSAAETTSRPRTRPTTISSAGRSPHSGPNTKVTGRPPRKPNDDDIK